MVYEGDLIVSGNETRTIDYEYDLIGNIIVKDDATLIIKNTVFNQTGKYVPSDVPPSGVNVVVKDRASFFLTNVTLTISQGVNERNDKTSRILVQDEAKIYIASSQLENFRYDISIWAMGQSSVYIENAIMRRARENVTNTVESCTLVVDDYSEVHVKNLTFDRVTVYRSSRVFIERSTLRNAVRVFDSPSIQVSDSTIGYVTAEGSPSLYIRRSIIESYISASESTTSADIWLLHMTIKEVRAGGFSKVRLIDASVEDLYMYENATLFVGWDLPLFGPLAFPSTLEFVIRLIVFNSFVVTIIVVLYVLIGKLRKWRLSETKVLKKT